MKILIIGDIVGRPGRKAVKFLAPKLREKFCYDFFIANAENAAGGSGITIKTTNELFAAGVDVITTGDHAFKQKDSAITLKDNRIIRPLNYPPEAAGKGWTIVTSASGLKVAVINLLGRTFMKPVDCPFRAIADILEEIQKQTNIILVDMHAEATSEKIGMGWYLNGKVSAVFGTHTHVQTADNEILSKGTAYISDLGMTGSHASILGREIIPVLEHFKTSMPVKFEVAKKDVKLKGVLLDLDEETGKAKKIDLVQESIDF